MTRVSPLAGRIWTVTGPVEADDLGITLIHEHLITDGSCYFRADQAVDADEFAHLPMSSAILERVRAASCSNYDNLRLDDPDLAIDEVREFVEFGGRTVVDVSSVGLNRDPEGLRRISEKAAVRVVMGCGFYCEYAHPDMVAGATVDDLTKLMIDEVQLGVDGVRAGVIGEIGINGQEKGTWRYVGEMTPEEEKVLRAAVRASLDTAAAVIVHQPNRASVVPEIIRVLEEEQARPDRVVLGHMSSIPDFDMHRRALDAGYWIAYDNFGMDHLSNEWFQPVEDQQRIDWLVELFEAGYRDQVVVSHDVWCKAQYRQFGGKGYAHLLRTVVPQLLERGLDRADIDTLLVDNPARVLAF